jgi:hypothetical protein
MRALVAGEGHAASASGDPVDPVHHAEHTRCLFRPA